MRSQSKTGGSSWCTYVPSREPWVPNPRQEGRRGALTCPQGNLGFPTVEYNKFFADVLNKSD